MIQNERITHLNDKKTAHGSYVLYWMQQSQRAEWNHALEYAIIRANELALPLLVFFGLTPSFPEANERHYRFMLEGLRDTAARLRRRGIAVAVQSCSPDRGAVELARDAALAVTDRGYLRIQRQWRASAAQSMKCPLIQVESDAIVPVESASPKEEYTAGTFRPKIMAHLPFYLHPLRHGRPRVDPAPVECESLDLDDIDAVIGNSGIDRSVAPVRWLRGGTGEAQRLLRRFIATRLDFVPEERNDPSKDCVSHLGPYLHFGQISPLYIALEVLKTKSPGRDMFLEELIVRRELSLNFVHYNDRYDSFQCLPGWARETLKKHGWDRRDYLYDAADLEQARTHDRYWNAAQRELLFRGKIHGYMRMYWGKKILEWTASPEEAYTTALHLNNKYSIDGRDPNGFAGVAWCFGKHDRAWGERRVFGKIRYMNDRGLARKFDMDRYIAKVESEH
ncbi:MAG TPA: deoxyribodipyrimidine photo-lyase [Spirochaetota bacterium]|nr:deoxyribodipyrimidine photo-lyase [Spirochaetota bacterium]HQF08949.1 deoxyribodipyrimidine photo-lyase [Spirochaetota bacterium]HQH98757.1 deoxyribodipyrimidine photo-lyase [Spirochaetota bacterium]HQJ72232.1 deoxyribodipyrimidine photo-lyase [Spirochaetota bacterium]